MRLLFLLLLMHNSCSIPECVVSLQHSENNVVYYGVTNEIDISTINGNCKNLRVDITNGQVEKIEACKYRYNPDSLGFSKIMIYKNTKLLETRILGVKPILDSTTLIAQINSHPNHSVISKRELLASYYINVKFNSKFNYMTLNFRLKGFNSILVSRDLRRRFSSKGDLLNTEFKTLVNELEEGDIIIFNNLEVEGFSKEIIRLTPYVIYIGK